MMPSSSSLNVGFNVASILKPTFTLSSSACFFHVSSGSLSSLDLDVMGNGFRIVTPVMVSVMQY